MGGSRGKSKVSKTMKRFREGTLPRGYKGGPKVTSKRQALAIGHAKRREAGE